MLARHMHGQGRMSSHHSGCTCCRCLALNMRWMALTSTWAGRPQPSTTPIPLLLTCSPCTYCLLPVSKYNHSICTMECVDPRQMRSSSLITNWAERDVTACMGKETFVSTLVVHDRVPPQSTRTGKACFVEWPDQLFSCIACSLTCKTLDISVAGCVDAASAVGPSKRWCSSVRPSPGSYHSSASEGAHKAVLAARP